MYRPRGNPRPGRDAIRDDIGHEASTSVLTNGGIEGETSQRERSRTGPTPSSRRNPSFLPIHDQIAMAGPEPRRSTSTASRTSSPRRRRNEAVTPATKMLLLIDPNQSPRLGVHARPDRGLAEVAETTTCGS